MTSAGAAAKLSITPARVKFQFLSPTTCFIFPSIRNKSDYMTKKLDKNLSSF
tara:strand:+ start:363 stop:518 length:156 start_codon:yes stop_codon:yes gene_type:complete